MMISVSIIQTKARGFVPLSRAIFAFQKSRSRYGCIRQELAARMKEAPDVPGLQGRPGREEMRRWD
jgi:hypothetical protein